MVDDCLPQIVDEGLKDSLEKFELDNRINLEVARTAKAEAEKTKCDMMMQGLEFSRVENALKDELQSVRQDNKELCKKLHDKLQDAVELESKIVPLREKIAALEEAKKTDAQKMANLEKRSIERETLMGKVEQDRDKASQELSETAVELARVREENSGLKKKADELELEATQVREENSGFKTKIDELQLEAAQVLTSDFGAALEQFACKYPDLDLSEFSVYNEVVDGKIVPPIDLSP
ncbi:coiled-coil domain-containing protein SCD2-like [Phaseolus vulgaris]|uniref:coiled-coil domain-containing protein SCD2-like n=1 Tax=Phaseolus vulgaris TaxID=3885 RepID=UPI0035CBBD5B